MHSLYKLSSLNVYEGEKRLSTQTSSCFDGCCVINGSLHIRRKSPYKELLE